MTDKPLCISYIRFSSAAQMDGSSLQRQLDLSRRYAEEHGLHLDEKFTYRDLGKSAYSGDHVTSGRFGDFLELVKRGAIPKGTVLLVESLDRLSREKVLDAFHQFQSIVNEDIKVVTLTDRMEYTRENLNNDFAKIIISMSIMARANEESEQKSKRISASWKIRRDQITVTKLTGMCPSWLRLREDRKDFDVIEERAKLIDRIFEMYSMGMGVGAIAKAFNTEMIPSWRSKRGWYPSYIRKIITNRALIGEFQSHTKDSKTRIRSSIGTPVKGYYPVIIDEDRFYAIQARMKNGTHLRGRTGLVNNLLSGIAYCGGCGSTMVFVNKGKPPNGHRYLVCHNASRGYKCQYASFRYEELETAFLSYCKEIDFKTVMALENEQERSLRAVQSKDLMAKQGNLIEIKRQIKLLEDEMPTIQNARELTFFRSKIGTLLQKEAEIEKDLDFINNEIARINASLDNADEFADAISNFIGSCNNMDDDERTKNRMRLREEIRQIIGKILVFPVGRTYSDEQIDLISRKYDEKIARENGFNKETLVEEKLFELENMRKTQNNTRDNRFFTIVFRNGNYRHIRYSPKIGGYHVTSEKTGDAISIWGSNGKDRSVITNFLNDTLETQ